MSIENCSLAKITCLLIITKIDAGTELMKKRKRNKRKEARDAITTIGRAAAMIIAR